MRSVDLRKTPRRDPEPEENVQLDPSVDDLERVSAFEAAGRRDQRWLVDTTGFAEALQAPDEIKIFHDRDRTKTA
jgi:hypothetical protein